MRGVAQDLDTYVTPISAQHECFEDPARMVGQSFQPEVWFAVVGSECIVADL
jgi:hypothetical protein